MPGHARGLLGRVGEHSDTTAAMAAGEAGEMPVGRSRSRLGAALATKNLSAQLGRSAVASCHLQADSAWCCDAGRLGGLVESSSSSSLLLFLVGYVLLANMMVLWLCAVNLVPSCGSENEGRGACRVSDNSVAP